MSATLLQAQTMCRACGWPAESLGGAGWAGPMRMCSHAGVQSTTWCCCNPVKRSMYSAAVDGAGGHLPSVTIEYCGVEIEADAQIGKDAVPSLTKALWNFLKVILSDTDAPGGPDIACQLASHDVIKHSWEENSLVGASAEGALLFKGDEYNAERPPRCDADRSGLVSWVHCRGSRAWKSSHLIWRP